MQRESRIGICNIQNMPIGDSVAWSVQDPILDHRTGLEEMNNKAQSEPRKKEDIHERVK